MGEGRSSVALLGPDAARFTGPRFGVGVALYFAGALTGFAIGPERTARWIESASGDDVERAFVITFAVTSLPLWIFVLNYLGRTTISGLRGRTVRTPWPIRRLWWLTFAGMSCFWSGRSRGADDVERDIGRGAEEVGHAIAVAYPVSLRGLLVAAVTCALLVYPLRGPINTHTRTAKRVGLAIVVVVEIMFLVLYLRYSDL